MPGQALKEVHGGGVECSEAPQLGASGYCRNCCDPVPDLWPVLGFLRTRGCKMAPGLCL